MAEPRLQTQPAARSTNSFRPHPTLTRYYADDGARQDLVRQAFDLSAHHYDGINRILSFGTDRWYRRAAIARAGIDEGMRVLDVGCGTGLAARYSADLVGPKGLVVGIDPSIGMLRQAIQKGRLHAPTLGKAESLPFPKNTFDIVTMSYALRHVSDLAVAFAQYRRVLKPGGKVVILELTLPSASVAYWAFKLWMKYLVPGLTRVTTRSRDAQLLYSYCWDTFDKSVPPETVLKALRYVGFQNVNRHVEARVFSEYQGVK